MDGLPTRRDFALGLVAAGTVLPASRWAIGFPHPVVPYRERAYYHHRYPRYAGPVGPYRPYPRYPHRPLGARY